MHRNAPLTPEGRLRLCQRLESGWAVAHAASSMRISRDRAYVWWRRYQEEGVAGLEDRSSRPHHCPTRTRASRERRITTLRTTRGLGPARIAGIVNMHSSTVHRVLVRHGLNRLDHLDRMTRTPIRRIEMSRPGELVQVDIKKLARIPRAGVGASTVCPKRPILDGTRSVTSTSIRPSTVTAAWPTQKCWPTNVASPSWGFGSVPTAFFETNGLRVERVLSDNGGCYRSRDFNQALGDAVHTFIRPYRPQTNGKAERFNRTLLTEWGYARLWN